MKKTILAFIILGFTSSLFARPSWCRNAHTYVEKRICHSRYLSDLDYELNDIYHRVKDILREEDRYLYRRLIRSERRWIRNRNADCYRRSNRCIARKYRRRIRYLHRYFRSIMD